MIRFLQRWAERRQATVLQAFEFPRAPLTCREVEWRAGAARGNAFFVWSGGVGRVLRAMEEDGLLRSFEVPAPIEFGAGAPKRQPLVTRYYELTAQGIVERSIVLDGRLI